LGDKIEIRAKKVPRLALQLLQAGSFWLDVRIQGQPILGSPFGLCLVPGPPAKLKLRSPLKSRTVELAAGVEHHLTIEAHDRSGNSCSRGGAHVEVMLRDPQALRCTLADRADGSYILTALGSTLGSFDCRLELLQRPDISQTAPREVCECEGGVRIGAWARAARDGAPADEGIADRRDTSPVSKW
jgi:hypothetical protein